MTDTASLRWLRLAGIAGIVGAILWTLGDALIVGGKAAAADYPLLFQTYAHQIEPDLAAAMVSSSETRLAAGALVADIGIVFYLAGSWHLFRGLLPAGAKWAWPIFALFICGNAWSPLGHAAFYYLGMAYKTVLVTPPAAHQALLDLAARFHAVLLIAWLLPIVTLGLALLGLGVVIAFGRTAWPRWFALIANPVSLVLLGMVIAFISPKPVSIWLDGAAFNLGWLAVYTLSTILLWKGERRTCPR
ncbi:MULTISPECIES: DUF6796 family protein [Sphingomonadaceae]|uniref:DUF6796 family protein n=1 Tax=Sphingomonadales TaxID=204457 RepID=UPI00077068AD|nr:DUF6796 family protein [Sphingobium sp. TKS]AMK23167.1 hypothetical protein K426_11125 [Sphingobium sp. TKS]MCF8707597.1 hypothetical protein [Rhizorhapis sp. SPR117]